MADEDYTLFVHVPEGTTLARAQASTAGSRDVPVRQDLAGRLLKVSFQGGRCYLRTIRSIRCSRQGVVSMTFGMLTGALSIPKNDILINN